MAWFTRKRPSTTSDRPLSPHVPVVDASALPSEPSDAATPETVPSEPRPVESRPNEAAPAEPPAADAAGRTPAAPNAESVRPDAKAAPVERGAVDDDLVAARESLDEETGRPAGAVDHDGEVHRRPSAVEQAMDAADVGSEPEVHQGNGALGASRFPRPDALPTTQDAAAPAPAGRTGFGATRIAPADPAPRPAASEPVIEPRDAERVDPVDVGRVDRVGSDDPLPVAAAVPASAAVTEEKLRLDRERAARREARLAALAQPAAAPEPEPAAPVIVRSGPGRWASWGLLALRLVTAFTLFVHGMNGLIGRDAAQQLWGNTILPPSLVRIVAIAVPGAQVLIALLLLFGLLTRFAGLLLALLMVATLALVYWGPWSIFTAGSPGFLGERELLLAAVGLLFLTVGAGQYSFDHGLRGDPGRPQD